MANGPTVAGHTHRLQPMPRGPLQLGASSPFAAALPVLASTHPLLWGRAPCVPTSPPPPPVRCTNPPPAPCLAACQCMPCHPTLERLRSTPRTTWRPLSGPAFWPRSVVCALFNGPPGLYKKFSHRHRHSPPNSRPLESVPGSASEGTAPVVATGESDSVANAHTTADGSDRPLALSFLSVWPACAAADPLILSRDPPPNAKRGPCGRTHQRAEKNSGV
jgi:hypothetical protein